MLFVISSLWQDTMTGHLEATIDIMDSRHIPRTLVYAVTTWDYVAMSLWLEALRNKLGEDATDEEIFTRFLEDILQKGLGNIPDQTVFAKPEYLISFALDEKGCDSVVQWFLHKTYNNITIPSPYAFIGEYEPTNIEKVFLSN